MKKNLLLGFLILFLLSTTAFAGLNDPKKESEKPAVSNTKENKLSNEELSRLTRRAEIDNLAKTNLLNKESNNSAKNLKTTKQVEVGRRHSGTIWISGGALILIIILVLLLV
jgi:cytochrome c-type biogenesis protein CcmH/NrfG